MANPNKPDQPGTGGTTNRPDQPKGAQSTTGGQQNYSFRCADMGHMDCSWETRGSSQDEVLRKAEQHGREKHNMSNMDENTRNQVRSHIRAA
jgi:predicted small metal-binding protein